MNGTVSPYLLTVSSLTILKMSPFVDFNAAEALELPFIQQPIPIEQYFQKPKRLVAAIADPTLSEQLSETEFRLKMRPIHFLEIYQIQPTVTLSFRSDIPGIILLESQDCVIQGYDDLNDRFSLKVKGRLASYQTEAKHYHLRGIANLSVKVALPAPLSFLPNSLIEMTGDTILKEILGRIKRKLLNQLLQDYYQWANNAVAIAASNRQKLKTCGRISTS